MIRRIATFAGIVSTLALAIHASPLVLSIATPALAACGDAADRGVDWSGCRKRNIIMSDFDFEGSDFTRADLSSSDLRRSNLNGATFNKANLVRASLQEATAMEANFSNAVASRTDFSYTDLRNANFAKAETNRTNFTGANLSGADLSKAEFARGVFSQAIISGVNFDYTNLSRSDFRGASFEAAPSMLNAYLFQTRVEGLDLSNVSGLENWQISLACGDENTKLPAGLQRPESWPCTDLDDD